MDAQPLWRAEDVAKYLAVPVSTIRYWTSKGFIPHIKLPAAVRFEPHAIVEWTRAMAKRDGGASTPRRDRLGHSLLPVRTVPAGFVKGGR